MNDLRVEKLKHKNEAIRVINFKLAIANGNITDELVGTVLTLASFEASLPTWSAMTCNHKDYTY
jgi:hypothetical protein